MKLQFAYKTQEIQEIEIMHSNSVYALKLRGSQFANGRFWWSADLSILMKMAIEYAENPIELIRNRRITKAATSQDDVVQ